MHHIHCNRSLAAAALFVFIAGRLTAQPGECQTGAPCAFSGTEWPAGLLGTFVPQFHPSSFQHYAGDYTRYQVTSGEIYEWTACTEDGALAQPYDTRLTLFTYWGDPVCHSDNLCGSNAKIRWTAHYTGEVRLRIDQPSCASNTQNTSVLWRCVSCPTVPSPSSGDADCDGTPDNAETGQLVFQSGAYMDASFNIHANATLSVPPYQSSLIHFTNVGFQTTASTFTLTEFTVVIRRQPPLFGTSPAVRVRVFTAEMDSIGNLAPQTIRSHGYLDLAAATGNWYQTIIAPNIGRTLRLPAINGFPGQSGFYIGVRLEGPNYANTANGWQRCQAPTTGTAFNTFAVSTPTVLQAGYYYFTPDGTPSYFSCSATGKFNYDSDGDTWIDGCDNCPSVYNPGQEDGDGNSIGDACDTPTGTGNLVLGPSFAIHPNPAAGDAVVWASLPGLRTLRFIDAAGRVAAELPFVREMSVEQLAPGVYVVMGLDEAGRELARTRFVRQ